MVLQTEPSRLILDRRRRSRGWYAERDCQSRHGADDIPVSGAWDVGTFAAGAL